MTIEEISKSLYSRYAEIESELNKRWSDPYPNDPLILERKRVLIRASVAVDVMGFNHLRDWIDCKGVKK